VNDGTAKAQTHYQQAEVQPIEIMQMYLTPEEFRGFLKGNLIEYSLKAKFKGSEQVDIDKAYQYAKWLGQALRGEKIDPREQIAKVATGKANKQEYDLIDQNTGKFISKLYFKPDICDTIKVDEANTCYRVTGVSEEKKTAYGYKAGYTLV
jgi:hypothetical protein